MENPTPIDPVLSAARRRILKIGAQVLPTLLTLQAKPAFGQNVCASLTMSAATSHGVVATPGCLPTP